MDNKLAKLSSTCGAHMLENHRHSQIYLQFLNLLHTVRGLPGFTDLDPLEERLLNLLATVWHADKKITVLTAMSICTDVSTTTIHRRLKSLRAKGLIVLVNDEIDTRIKYVTPTNMAFQYFAQLGQCIEQTKTS